MITWRIFDWAAETPGKTAVIHNGNRISYAAFARLIAVARGYFARRGCVGDGYAVLAVQHLMDFWILSLALRSLGLTTVPVPSVHAIGNLRLSPLRCVVTTETEGWEGLDRLCAERRLPVLSATLAGEPALWPGASDGGETAGGHVLRTSGTTGFFKMVLMNQAADAVLLQRKVDIIGMDRDTVLAVFDFPAWTGAGYRWAASPWIVGGTTVIEQGPELHRALGRPGLTHAVLVPEMLATILATPAGAFPRNEALRLAVGGGAMTRAQVAEAKARITPRLSNWLASTEAGGIALTPLETAEDHRWHRLAPGGLLEIVDDADRPAAPGMIGRVRIATKGGPTSYLLDEVATRAFFRDGFFYPGDLAIMRSDGRIALHGRLTDIINVRGIKISPASVEDQLCDILRVRGVCLFSMQNDGGEEEIHVVIEAPAAINTEPVTDVLRRGLGDVCRARIHVVQTLPRNGMGKIVRQAVQAQLLGARPPTEA